MKNVFIYCLLDQDLVIRYVGKTVDTKRRLWSHIIEAKLYTGKRYVLNWIKSMLSKGLTPELRILEVCREDNWQDREIYWIDYYRKISPKLCNISDGGIGNTGAKTFSVEEIEVRRKNARSRFSSFSEQEKHNIWELIKSNYSIEMIKSVYINYSRQIDFGVKNGRQWNHITGIPKSDVPKKRMGYQYNNGYYRVFNKDRKVIFSSKNEENVKNWLLNSKQ